MFGNSLKKLERIFLGRDPMWASRGLEVIEEQFESVGKNKFKWTIIARKKKEAK